MKTNLYTVNAAPNALRRPIGLFLGLVALIVFATTVVNVASASIVYPTNNGFEQPDLGSDGHAFQYFPSSPGWTFTAGINPHFGDGIAANGSFFNLAGATNGNNDNGATSTAGQAAFLQAGDGTLASGYFSQTLTLPGGSAVLFLSLEGRIGGADGVNVFLNGVQVGGTLFPANLGSFNNVSVNLGNLTAGSYTIAFAGDDPIPGADRTTFVDNVTLQIGSVPDGGSTVSLLGLASLGLVALRRKLRC